MRVHRGVSLRPAAAPIDCSAGVSSVVRFAHLHVHSHYSILESNARLGALCNAAVEHEQDRIALTDSGNLFGSINFYKAARARNLTPVLGCEVNVAATDHTLRDPKQPVYHLTLLAENLVGWHNLIRLVSAGWLEGFYFRPRVSKELLARYSEGLIALSGDMTSELSRRVLAKRDDEALRCIGEHQDIFGKDRYFIEVMENEIATQRTVREGLLDLGARSGTKMVLTNDVHYLHSEHAAAREVMMCIGSGKTLADETRWRLDTDKHHFRSSREMAALFKGAEPLCEAAYEVAARCNVELELGAFHLPKFQVPTAEDEITYFRRICREGCIALYGAMTEAVEQRLVYEMEVIEAMGFVAYFLITADFMSWSRKNDIPVGPGRGSAAGSIVAYALRITDVDPLKYDLLFERFLNRGRVSMPDIDIDFCRDKRERVIHYVQEKYGHESVCQIVTFGTLAAKAAIRDTGRVLGIDLGRIDSIAKKIPTVPGTKLKEAIEQEPDLVAMRDSDPQVARLFKIALSIEGLNRHTSTHAAGVVVTDKPVSEYAPLCLVQGQPNTQFAMTELEDCGLLKMDFLGLKTLTVIARAEALLREQGVTVDCTKLPLDDRRTYEMLQKGSTTGVFQLESSGMRELLQKMQPDVFEDIVAILALYRPGPLGSGMVDSFVDRKHGREPIEYPHESLEPILKETYGVMVYQEQIMRISNALAGFTLEEADNLRKAMGKKKPEVMEKFKGKFVDGGEKNGVKRKTATEIWETMAFFAGYGFNKSHTVAYGLVTYQTAWLKANHPKEFLAACMSIDRGDADKVAVYLEECRRDGTQVLVPDINQSALDFAIRDGAIRFGLGAIKGVGEKPVEAILEARARLGRPFRTLIEVFEEIDTRSINRSVYEAMIHAGAFDWTGHPRARVSAALETLMKIAQNRQADKRAGQMDLFGALKGAAEADITLPDVAEWPLREKLNREKEALGLFLSDNPLNQHASLLARFSTHAIEDLGTLEHRTEVTIGGSVQGVRVAVTKRGRSAGKKFAMFKVAGLAGVGIQSIAFAEDYEKITEFLEDDAIGLFTGVVDQSREEPNLRVIDAIPVEQVLSRQIDRVILILDDPPEHVLRDVKDTITHHSGATPVYLSFPGVDGNDAELIRCGTKFKIRVTEDSIDALGRVVGRENVSLR